MIRKMSLLFLLLVCFRASAAGPEGAPPLSLVDAVRTALEKHPALQRAEAAVSAADAAVKQVRANYFPQLSFSGIAKAGLSGATGALGLPGMPASPFFRNTAYSANWYQTVFDFGRTKRRLASQEALAKSARLRKQAEEDRIVLAVRRAYFSTLEAQRLERLAQETVKERRLTLERVQAYFQAQMRPQLEVNLAQANLAEAEGVLIHTRSAVHTAFAALNVAMGVEGQPSYALEEPSAEILPLPPLEELLETAGKQRPDLQALEAKLTALSEAAGLARRQRLPEVRGFGSGGQGRFGGTTVKPEQRHGVGALGVFFPFFTGGRLEAEEKAARAELQGAQATREELRQQIRFEVTQAYDQMLDLKDRIQVTAEGERAAQSALGLAKARFQVGLASFLELTTAEVVLAQAEAVRARALYDYQRARAEMEFFTGRTVTPPRGR